jgi:hypothetical protein
MEDKKSQDKKIKRRIEEEKEIRGRKALKIFFQNSPFIKFFAYTLLNLRYSDDNVD